MPTFPKQGFDIFPTHAQTGKLKHPKTHNDVNSSYIEILIDQLVPNEKFLSCHCGKYGGFTGSGKFQHPERIQWSSRSMLNPPRKATADKSMFGSFMPRTTADGSCIPILAGSLSLDSLRNLYGCKRYWLAVDKARHLSFPSSSSSGWLFYHGDSPQGILFGLCSKPLAYPERVANQFIYIFRLKKKIFFR